MLSIISQPNIVEDMMSEAKTFSDLQAQIQSEYDHLSKRLKQVAEYIINNHDSVSFDTIAVIGKKADVPPSTLIRFANAFGFSGFNEIKQLARDNLIQETSSYTERAKLTKKLDKGGIETSSIYILEEFARASAHSLKLLTKNISAEDLQKAIDILIQADTIYIIGLGRSFSVATYLAYTLRHMERKVMLIDGLGGMYREQLASINASDAVFSISFSPYADETLLVNEAALEAGANQIVVTDSQISPLAISSDVCFVVKETQVDAFRSQCSTHCLIQSISVAMTYQIAKSK
nr:MurR/RpiR family transcriptional regulator [uncultured Cohaesibacter sp.]